MLSIFIILSMARHLGRSLLTTLIFALDETTPQWYWANT
jgi:hypothetical protein